MTLSIKSPDDLTTLIVNAIQAESDVPIDFTEGAIPLAMVEGDMGMGLYLQELFVETEAKTRLKTSKGNDKITFGQDFGFIPPPAASGTTNCTFYRTSATQQALVPVGSQVQTPSAISPSGSVVFVVVADTSNPAYDPSLQAYVMPPSTFNVPALVQCVTPGSIGNVSAGTITQITSPIPGVSSVTNLNPVTNGTDVPAGTAYDQAFALYILSLGNATPLAITGATSQLQAALDVKVIEYEDFNLNPYEGFTVIVDDGTGDPPDSLMAAAYSAVLLTHSAGVPFGVFKPLAPAVNIEADIKINTAAGYVFSDVQTQVVTALNDYFSSSTRTLKIGISLIYTKIYEIIYDASPGITDVEGLLVNGSDESILANDNQKLIVGTITINNIT